VPPHAQENFLRRVFGGSRVTQQTQAVSEDGPPVRSIKSFQIAFCSWADDHGASQRMAIVDDLPGSARHTVRPIE
jgi:hypothetical protein